MLALFVLVPVHRTLCAVSAAISKPWLRALEVCTMQVTKTDLGPATLGMVLPTMPGRVCLRSALRTTDVKPPDV